MHVKVERGNDVLVRVGGGFISVQKFIDTYMQSEVERVDRQDVVGRFENKIKAQKISANQSVYSVESSPIRTPKRDGSQTSRTGSKSPNTFNFRNKPFQDIRFQKADCNETEPVM